MKNKSVILLIVTVVASILLLGAVGSKPKLPMWEYKAIVSVKALNEIEEKQEGWDVIGFSVGQGDNHHILLRRQKPH